MMWDYGTDWNTPTANKPRDNYVEMDSGVLGIDGIAVAVSQTGSGGVCIDEETVKRDAADFAEAASRAVKNGQTIDQVMCNGASLSEAAKAEIYAQACIQQGTSPEAIAEKAQQEQEQTMALLQQGILGMAGLAAGTQLGQGVTGGEHVSPALLCTLATPNVPDCRAPGLAQGFGLS